MALQVSDLVINCGTSSMKMTLFSQSGRPLIEGSLREIFSSAPTLEINGERSGAAPLPSYTAALETLVQTFERVGLDRKAVRGIGHRVVHGGRRYVQSTLITQEVERGLAKLSELAPLHNPPALHCISKAKELFPDRSQVAVFDTAFHASLPPHAASYPIPYELAQKHGIKRYGFHGIAHHFSWQSYLARFAKPQAKVVTLHLGSGASLAAIDSGVSLDTTMGFTPLDGLMMATRSGELDPAIVSYLSVKEGKTAEEIVSLLNEESGLLGVSKKSADMRELEQLAPTDGQAQLAIDMFVYRVIKHLGGYIALLGGLDALIFSGGIGERSFSIRSHIVRAFGWMGLKIDEEKNHLLKVPDPGSLTQIHHPGSIAQVVVVGSDENRYIQSELSRLLG